MKLGFCPAAITPSLTRKVRRAPVGIATLPRSRHVTGRASFRKAAYVHGPILRLASRIECHSKTLSVRYPGTLRVCEGFLRQTLHGWISKAENISAEQAKRSAPWINGRFLLMVVGLRILILNSRLSRSRSMWCKFMLPCLRWEWASSLMPKPQNTQCGEWPCRACCPVRLELTPGHLNVARSNGRRPILS